MFEIVYLKFVSLYICYILNVKGNVDLWQVNNLKMFNIKIEN